MTGQAGGVIKRMPASNYMHSEHAQCALHSSGAPAAESLEALPRLSESQASSFLARTHVMIDFKRLYFLLSVCPVEWYMCVRTHVCEHM